MIARNNIECITSDCALEDIDANFKIIAGPGAGKTYWLVRHIRNVLKNSTKILSASKIACITYTNVAVEEIQERLEIMENKVEVSTIHSFLYKNIVQPYIYLLKDSTGKSLVNYKEMDGHDAHIPSSGKINIWKKENNLYGIVTDDRKLNDCLKSLDWIFEEEEIVLTTKDVYKRKVGKYFIKEEYFPSYKQLYWNEGTIHHEDVLYFSYLLLENHPIILKFLRARYPYVFIDEFQDTNPIQTRIIKLLADSGVVVGVIGDPAQSIYKFAGAERQDFLDFELPKQKNYYMNSNRRSTNKIIDFLNYLRGKDQFHQNYHRNVIGNDICLIIGETPLEIINKFKSKRELLELNDRCCFLTRKNEQVTELKACINNYNYNYEIWEELYLLDYKRHEFLNYIFVAQGYAIDRRYEMAVKEILKIFKTNQEGYLKEPFKNSKINNKLFKRSYALELLEFLINNYEMHLDKNLYQFYNEELYNFFIKFDFHLKRLTGKGKFKVKSEKVTVKELVNSLNIREVRNDNIRTIHKAKGTEFESVLVYFDDINEIDAIINPDIDSEEDDHRLYYVAFSRAEDFLCIATKSIDDEQEKKLGQLNIRIL